MKDAMNVTITVQVRTDQWKYIETREVSAQVMSGRELEGLAYGLGSTTEAVVQGIAKRLMAAEGMEEHARAIREAVENMKAGLTVGETLPKSKVSE